MFTVLADPLFRVNAPASQFLCARGERGGSGNACLGPSGRAKIVYKAAHVPIIKNGGVVELDLNHDGIDDFKFVATSNPILAGKAKGPDIITLQPASLGHLAHGAAAITAWRVKEEK